mmetsp:Transcript_50844/g.115472  ORF Transcript_50844/g.115472 Transcript_50844/m.115472 type:complete len:213 (-) Transcript_50844:294-932(-)
MGPRPRAARPPCSSLEAPGPEPPDPAPRLPGGAPAPGASAAPATASAAQVWAKALGPARAKRQRFDPSRSRRWWSSTATCAGRCSRAAPAPRGPRAASSSGWPRWAPGGSETRARPASSARRSGRPPCSACPSGPGRLWRRRGCGRPRWRASRRARTWGLTSAPRRPVVSARRAAPARWGDLLGPMRPALRRRAMTESLMIIMKHIQYQVSF